MMAYFARQLIDMVAAPLMIALLMTVAGAILWTCRRPGTARWLFMAAAAFVYFASLPLVGDALLEPLEQRYPPLAATDPLPNTGYVVVLGSSYWPRANASVAAALGEDGLSRIVEGVRIVRRLGTARLVVSGGATQGRAPSALGYAELARELGVDNASLVVLDGSLNTRAEARAIATLTRGDPFILVTSAFHMPRAVRLMEQVKAQPIPAPTGQQTGAGYAHYWNYVVPSSTGLRRTERALHEYLGLAASAVHLD